MAVAGDRLQEGGAPPFLRLGACGSRKGGRSERRLTMCVKVPRQARDVEATVDGELARRLGAAHGGPTTAN